MNIMLIRHGETEDNRKGSIYGQEDRGLSEVGKKQAHQAALLLKDEKIDFVYSSDLQRCVETVETVLKYHAGLVPTTTTRLREIGGGKASKLPLRLPPYLLDRAIRIALLLNFAPPGGESWSKVKLRVKNFLNELFTAHPNATILIVSHNVTIQAAQSLLKQQGGKEPRGVTVPNCSVHYFSMSKPLE